MPTQNELATATFAEALAAFAGVPLPDGDGQAGRLIEKAAASAEAHVVAGTVGETAWTIAEAMYVGAPELVDIDRAIGKVRAVATDGDKSARVAEVSVWVLLALACRRAAETDFTSRRTAERWRERLVARLDAAIDAAALYDDLTGYHLLRDLQRNVISYFAETVRPLPRMVEKTFQTRLPSLVVSHRLYQEIGRAEEIEAENRVCHPLFVPTEIEVLSR